MGHSVNYEQLLDNQLTAVLLLTRELQIIYANPAAEDLFSRSIRQLQKLALPSLIRKEDLDCNWLCEQLIQHQSLRVCEIRLELPSQNHILDLSANLIEGEQGSQILMELHPQDLHLNSQPQLHPQQRALRQLLRNLAHEIKNPLGGLKGAAQLLSKQLTDPKWQPYTEMLLSQSERLAQLVERMLGPRKLEPMQPVNLHQLLEQQLELLAIDTPKAIVFKRDYDPSLPEIPVASASLQQALLNIMLNGIQAMGDSGTLNIKTRSIANMTLNNKRYRLTAMITIGDTGPGIPDEIRPNLFVPMVTGRADGTGLGLSIAQELIARHDGHIEWQSDPGDTSFTLYLPYQE
ncbi:nitrogen regulation protein NR(II) [Dongshaea marina]|uniref:nitrogen regulation protein NR(II) n=1 Tax=Dongshaea marina TaxID=2047966 RepID=UPI000D3E02D8|nr:nitrogen regulation protein NR(II) [Dongshaea marina]